MLFSSQPARPEPVTLGELLRRIYTSCKGKVQRWGLDPQLALEWAVDGIIAYRKTANLHEAAEIDAGQLSLQTALNLQVFVAREISNARRREARRIKKIYGNGKTFETICNSLPARTDNGVAIIDALDEMEAFGKCLPESLRRTFEVWRLAVLETGESPTRAFAASVLGITEAGYGQRMRKIFEHFRRFAARIHAE